MWIIVDNFVDNSVAIGYRIKISDFRWEKSIPND